MVDLGRRDFLKLMGLAGTTAAVGASSQSARRLIPYIAPPEQVLPGSPTWFASTCRECPAGCGLLAKNVDGRVIKVEGNPLHPVNTGKLCARGQASLHGLYNPDRFRGPLRRTDEDRFEQITWADAENILVERLLEIVQEGKSDRIVFMTGLTTGILEGLITHWLSEMGAGEHVVYEPLAYEALRRASQVVFGVDAIPSFRIDKADFLISFGAGFLETWLSNVEYARQFAAFHAPHAKGKNFYAYVGPRLSLTATNADRWIPVVPGDEGLVALGMIKIILDGGLARDVDAKTKAAIRSMVGSIDLAAVTQRTGLTEESLGTLARRFAEAKAPLALAEGLSFASPSATDTAVAANLLCALFPGARQVIDFAGISVYSRAAPARKIKELAERMKNREIELLLIDGPNPLHFLPPSWGFQDSLKSVPTVVSFSSAMDETSQRAHLVLPVHTPLEAWGDYSPRNGVIGLMQPIMGALFDTRHMGDVLIGTGKRIKGEDRFPWKDFYQLLRTAWLQKGEERAPGVDPDVFWRETVQRGGMWESSRPEGGESEPSQTPSHYRFTSLAATGEPDEGFHFTAYPTVQFFDGRGANRAWLQEMPDPISQITWGSWVEIHQDTARKMGIQHGDLLRIKSPHGSVEAPAYLMPSVPPQTIAMPIGQGHTAYGRFADFAQYGNPMELLPADLDKSSGGMLRPAFNVTIEKRGRIVQVAHTDGSLFQHGRGLVRTMRIEDYMEGTAAHRKPHLFLPLPAGYTLEKDFYPPHEHIDYRWAMVIDLDRCIGCGACVVACYAENNVAIVGKEQIVRGREMSWLRVQRYFDEDRPVARHLPLPCQHCDNAPCESVCPVYAPHHSREGLNNQVYNRCIGTRFCAQNCPYKIRRFNWFTFTRPEPLNYQLNPNVTVRQKGVMEKCSFCIQRIVEAKRRARNEGRMVRDGEFTTACAQTCPTDTIVFGNLMDPGSRVSQLIEEHRAYQVLDHLNTKPAVFYLKRLVIEA